jgi:serine/threonine-protein kinase
MTGLSTALGSLRPGRRLGRYELLLPVGRGGSAVVWAACNRDEGGERLYAVKTILHTLSDDTHFREMFGRESRIASRIRHTNVCNVLEFGEHRGTLYLVMEWIDGEPLSALLPESTPLPVGIAARIVIDVARGLEAAHELTDETGNRLGVVHRDVSPQNILVGPDGVAKIADFGVAKATEAGTRRTQSGYIKGKVDYLSPEQAFSEPIDARADVFALGAVLYEITTGRRPFAADSQMATLVKITSPVAPEWPEELVPGYPAALASVVMRALAKDKVERYGDMAAFVEHLTNAMLQVGLSGHDEVARHALSIAGDRRSRRTRAIQSALTHSATDAAAHDEPAPQQSSATPTSHAPTPSPTSPRPSWLARFATLAGVTGVAVVWALNRSPEQAPSAPLPSTARPVVSISNIAPATPSAAPAGSLDGEPVKPQVAPASASSVRPKPVPNKRAPGVWRPSDEQLLESRE